MGGTMPSNASDWLSGFTATRYQPSIPPEEIDDERLARALLTATPPPEPPLPPMPLSVARPPPVLPPPAPPSENGAGPPHAHTAAIAATSRDQFKPDMFAPPRCV